MKIQTLRASAMLLACVGVVLLPLAVGADAPPPSVVKDSVRITTYDGVSDDLLSAGLNLAGLVNPVSPGFTDPLHPTAVELRRRAIHLNFRGLVDAVPAGGMGLLWGPQSPGTPTFPGVPFGLIPGVEYTAYLRVPRVHGNINNVTAIVKIPRHFESMRACIVAVAPPGPRGVYGGISAAEWALFRGCAVVLQDKGTGVGFHLLGGEMAGYAVDDIDGVFGSVEMVGAEAQFAEKDSSELAAFVARSPYRVAMKYAHSQLNPERLWGRFALTSIEFAFWALNDHLETRGDRRLDRGNTIVIAAGVSNGAGTALRALEDDEEQIIDGVVASEPNIGPGPGPIAIRFGSAPPFAPAGRSNFDSYTLMATYGGCAALSSTLAGTPFFGRQPLGAPPGALENRCASLKEKGLISGDSLTEQAASAVAVLRANGYAEGQDWGIAFFEFANTFRSFQSTLGAAAGRFTVWDNICGVSFAPTDALGRPAPLAEAAAKRLFADSVGIPGTFSAAGGITFIADTAQNGPIAENMAVSRSTGRADLNLDSALCFRYLATGDPAVLAASGIASDGDAVANRARVQAGIRETETTGRLRGRPALVVQGRQDTLAFPNTQARAYYALNQVAEGARSQLRYIEVTTAQHADANISTFFLKPGVGAQFAPLHFYFLHALDMMWEHLTNGAALPPSQVVRPTPRGLEPYTSVNVPVLLPLPSHSPAPEALITFRGGVLSIPE